MFLRLLLAACLVSLNAAPSYADPVPTGTDVDFLDSAGVHGLFRMLAGLDGQGKRLVVVAPRHGRARRVLEILDVQSLVRLCESRDEALQDAA